MSRYVIDASVAVEYLLRTNPGRKIAELMEGAFLLAPALLDVEVLSVLRRAVQRQKLEERRAVLALEDLVSWPIDRIPHTMLIQKPGVIGRMLVRTTRFMLPSLTSMMPLCSP